LLWSQEHRLQHALKCSAGQDIDFGLGGRLEMPAAQGVTC